MKQSIEALVAELRPTLDKIPRVRSLTDHDIKRVKALAAQPLPSARPTQLVEFPPSVEELMRTVLALQGQVLLLQSRLDEFDGKAGHEKSMRDYLVEDPRFTGILPELLAPGRTQPLAQLRFHAIRLLFDNGFHPLAIARFFHRDRKSIAHALQRTETAS